MTKYESIYSDRKVSAAQYIAELVCLNRANKLGIDLPIYFWNSPQWKQFYTLQLIHANKLLKEFDEASIIKFARQKKIWSLANGWVKNAVKDFVPEHEPEFTPVEVIEEPVFQRTKQIDMDFLDG